MRLTKTTRATRPHRGAVPMGRAVKGRAAKGRAAKGLAAAAVATALAASVAAPAQARTTTDPASHQLATATGVAQSVTGAGVTALRTPEKSNGLTLRPATVRGRDVPTLVHRAGREVSVIAVLSSGQSSADFADALPPGQRLEPADGGGMAIMQGDNVVGSVAAPWARDAKGRSLPTRYELRPQGGLRQVVDTRGATFPVVADPKYSLGFYRVPVWYIEYYWSDMWRNKLLMDKYGSPTGAVVAGLCSAIPYAPAKAVCAYFVKARWSTLRSQLNYGIANKRCLKVRSGFGITDMFVWTAWTKTCIK